MHVPLFWQGDSDSKPLHSLMSRKNHFKQFCNQTEELLKDKNVTLSLSDIFINLLPFSQLFPCQPTVQLQ